MFSAFLGHLNMAVAGDAVSGISGEATRKKSIAVFTEKMRVWACLVWKKISKVGRDDPKIVIHSLKFGISLTLVSLLYLMEPLFKGIGETAIWAVMTVVVVLEFTAGSYFPRKFFCFPETIYTFTIKYFTTILQNCS